MMKPCPGTVTKVHGIRRTFEKRTVKHRILKLVRALEYITYSVFNPVAWTWTPPVRTTVMAAGLRLTAVLKCLQLKVIACNIITCNICRYTALFDKGRERRYLLDTSSRGSSRPRRVGSDSTGNKTVESHTCAVISAYVSCSRYGDRQSLRVYA